MIQYSSTGLIAHLSSPTMVSISSPEQNTVLATLPLQHALVRGGLGFTRDLHLIAVTGQGEVCTWGMDGSSSRSINQPVHLAAISLKGVVYALSEKGELIRVNSASKTSQTLSLQVNVPPYCMVLLNEDVLVVALGNHPSVLMVDKMQRPRKVDLSGGLELDCIITSMCVARIDEFILLACFSSDSWLSVFKVHPSTLSPVLLHKHHCVSLLEDQLVVRDPQSMAFVESPSLETHSLIVGFDENPYTRLEGGILTVFFMEMGTRLEYTPCASPFCITPLIDGVLLYQPVCLDGLHSLQSGIDQTQQKARKQHLIGDLQPELPPQNLLHPQNSSSNKFEKKIKSSSLPKLIQGPSQVESLFGIGSLTPGAMLLDIADSLRSKEWSASESLALLDLPTAVDQCLYYCQHTLDQALHIRLLKAARLGLVQAGMLGSALGSQFQDMIHSVGITHVLRQAGPAWCLSVGHVQHVGARVLLDRALYLHQFGLAKALRPFVRTSVDLDKHSLVHWTRARVLKDDLDTEAMAALIESVVSKAGYSDGFPFAAVAVEAFKAGKVGLAVRLGNVEKILNKKAALLMVMKEFSKLLALLGSAHGVDPDLLAKGVYFCCIESVDKGDVVLDKVLTQCARYPALVSQCLLLFERKGALEELFSHKVCGLGLKMGLVMNYVYFPISNMFQFIFKPFPLLTFHRTSKTAPNMT